MVAACSMVAAIAELFWLSDAQRAVIEPFVRHSQSGPELKEDRRITSGILHVLTSGLPLA